MSRATPWGQADTEETLALGIISVTTPSHGGIMLSAARQREIAEVGARTFGDRGLQWWEEDADWSVPYWFFREAIAAYGPPENHAAMLVYAQSAILAYHPECSKRLLTGAEVHA